MDPQISEAVDPADRSIVITRRLDAPPALVFQAWTDPEHIGMWWGPRGFTTTVHAMDVRPGGVWRFTMHGPDGVDYPNRVVYEEIVAPERLVYVHDSDVEDDPARFHVTVTFEESEGGTALIMRSIFPSVAELERVKAFGAVEGGNSTVDRLAEYLAAGH